MDSGPFPLSAVTLLPGPFLDNMNRTLAYLGPSTPTCPGRSTAPVFTHAP